MLVYIFRHGESEAPAKGKGHATEERHLTPDGRMWAKRVVSVAEKEIGFRPAGILSSPLAPAKETREIALQKLARKTEIQIENCLLGERPFKGGCASRRKFKWPVVVQLGSH